jgi:8-oxo-dGTP pyrophosphatase MutT (NUDIX family)
MQHYVLVFARSRTLAAPEFTPILVIAKQKPAWQLGKLNLIGGKVEPNEPVLDAAVRELKEETGLELHSNEIELMGEITGETWHIWCYSAVVTHTVLEPQPGEMEKVFWMNWGELKNDPRLIPNLKVIIPLMLAGAKDWVIKDDTGVSGDRHEFTVEVSAK